MENGKMINNKALEDIHMQMVVIWKGHLIMDWNMVCLNTMLTKN